MPDGARTSSSIPAPHLRLHYAGQTPAAQRSYPHLKSNACLALKTNERVRKTAHDPTAAFRGFCPDTLLPSSYITFKNLSPGRGGRPEPGPRGRAWITRSHGRAPGTGPSPYRRPAGGCGQGQAGQGGRGAAGASHAERRAGQGRPSARRRTQPGHPLGAYLSPRPLPPMPWLPGRDPPPLPAEPSRIPHATAAERLPTFRTTLWSRPLPGIATRRGSGTSERRDRASPPPACLSGNEGSRPVPRGRVAGRCHDDLPRLQGPPSRSGWRDAVRER